MPGIGTPVIYTETVDLHQDDGTYKQATNTYCGFIFGVETTEETRDVVQADKTVKRIPTGKRVPTGNFLVRATYRDGHSKDVVARLDELAPVPAFAEAA